MTKQPDTTPRAVCTCGANDWTTSMTVKDGKVEGVAKCNACGREYPAEKLVKR